MHSGLTHPLHTHSSHVLGASSKQSISTCTKHMPSLLGLLLLLPHIPCNTSHTPCTHTLHTHPHTPDPGWCAYATDSAGNNLDDWQGSRKLAQCAERCANVSQCSFWVGRPGHCWLKYSALVGADGWTSAYRSAWLDTLIEPNAAATCFKRLQDWRELGQQLSECLVVWGLFQRCCSMRASCCCAMRMLLCFV